MEILIEESMVRINVTVPKGALARIDRYAAAHGMSRSAFLIQSARQVMAKKPIPSTATCGGGPPSSPRSAT